MLGDSLRRRARPRPSTPPRTRAPRPRGRVSWQRWLVAAIVVAGVAFGVGYFLSTQVLFPRPEAAGSGIAVPDLYGRDRAEAERLVTEAGLVVGGVEELASTDAAPGTVLAQAPVPGQQLRPGSAVTFAVSAGPPALRVPPVVGLGAETARALLESTGFDVLQEPIRDYAQPEGAVVRTDPPAGSVHTLPARVTLLVAVAPDTAAAPAAEREGGWR